LLPATPWLLSVMARASAFAPAPRADKQVEAREQRLAFLEGKLKKKDEVLAELREGLVALKKVLGDLKSQWVPHDTRDQEERVPDVSLRRHVFAARTARLRVSWL
jgi:hypothetical protein